MTKLLIDVRQDLVEVVRCKDCVHAISYESGGYNCLTCPNVDMDVDADWFCADGESDNDEILQQL